MPQAKLFTNGGSQAVRLPAEFRFEGDTVNVRRDALTGDVIISKPHATWDDYFTWVGTLDLPDDFLDDRHQSPDEFRDPFAPKKRVSRQQRA
jgi:antitoxin VapB